MPKRIVLDIDNNLDIAARGQQLELFVVFDGESRFVAAVLRPAKRAKSIEILVQDDGHDDVSEVINLCRAMDLRFILGAPTNATLRKHVKSWSRTERIIARVETGHQGTDTRFIVTDLASRSKELYEKVYCRCDVAENHIKA